MDNMENYHNYKKFSNKRKFNYDTGFRYGGRCSNPYPQYNWYRGSSRYPKRYKKTPVRPPSPLRGTEEYRQRKIQHTSELIKRKLLTGENISDVLNYESDRERYAYSVQDRVSGRAERRIPRTRTQSFDENLKNDKHKSKDSYRFRKTSTSECIDIEEIQNKIMKYITNLNHGRKVNLINSASSFYDNAIQQIQRQKRLELSRALRAMCSNKTTESVDVINSIIPDIGIKLEDLPRQVIEQLSLTLNFDCEEQVDDSMFGNSNTNCKQQDMADSYRSLNNYPSTATTIIRDNICEEDLQLQNIDSSPQNPVNYLSPTPTIVHDNTSLGENIKSQDFNSDPDKLTTHPSSATTIIRDLDSTSHNHNYPNLMPTTVQKNIYLRETLKLQEISPDRLNNYPTTAPTSVGNRFEPIDWAYSMNIKKETIEEIDDQCSVETVLLDESLVQDTNGFFKLHDGIPPLCTVNKNNFSCNLKQEQANNEIENDVHGEHQSHNISDDCIILPPKPVEVIDVDDDPTSTTVCKDSKPSVMSEQVNCGNTNNVLLAEANRSRPHDTTSTSDFSSQFNYDTLYDENPKTLQTAIQLMLQIDTDIERLTRIRQNLFININEAQHRVNENNIEMNKPKDSAVVYDNGISTVNNVVKETGVKNNTAQSTTGNSERVLRRLTKKYIGKQSPQALKRDRFSAPANGSHQGVRPYSTRTPQDDSSSAIHAATSSSNSSVPHSTNQTNLLFANAGTAAVSNINPITSSRSDIPSVLASSLLINVALPGTDPGVKKGVTTNEECFGKNNLELIPPSILQKDTHSKKTNGNKRPVEKNDNRLVFNIKQKVLVALHIGKRIFLGTDNGKLYVAALHNGVILKAVHVSSQSVTSLCYMKSGGNRVYVGTLSLGINSYDINTYLANDFVNTGHSVQCMEREWGYLFIGCQSGNLYRYSFSKKRIEFEDLISSTSIMAIKAVLEGARKVLLIASRGNPICIRDAMSALHMRTVDPMVSPTIYSMIVLRGDIYCGTLSNDLLVYSFYDGVLKAKLKETDAKGITCLKFVSPVVFASCYDGNIYVYHTSPRRFLGKIAGPGGSILSMEIYRNKVFVGTNKSEFVDLIIPVNISKVISQSFK